MVARLVTPLGSGVALHGEQGGLGVNVQDQTPGTVPMVNAQSQGYDFQAVTPSGAGLKPAIATKTADYAVTTADSTLLGDATLANIAFTLPAAAAATGYIFTFKKVDASANTVTVSGAQNIDGQASYILTTQYAAMQIQSNGVTWSLLNEKA